MKELFSLNGRYVGRGVNHEGQSFEGAFVASSAGEGQGLSFTFNASGKNGVTFHSEASLIGFGMSGKPALWVLSNNHPGVFERVLKSTTTDGNVKSYVFAFGDPADRSSFREEILLDIAPSSVRYVYSWGLPGGDFAERSGCSWNGPSSSGTVRSCEFRRRNSRCIFFRSFANLTNS